MEKNENNSFGLFMVGNVSKCITSFNKETRNPACIN